MGCWLVFLVVDLGVGWTLLVIVDFFSILWVCGCGVFVVRFEVWFGFSSIWVFVAVDSIMFCFCALLVGLAVLWLVGYLVGGLLGYCCDCVVLVCVFWIPGFVICLLLWCF